MLYVVALLSSLTIGQSLGSIGDGPVANADTGYAVTLNGNAFSNVAINTAKTTDWLKVKGFRWVEWVPIYAWAAASAVTMQCDQSEDGVNAAPIQVLTFTANTAASANMIWSNTVSGNENWAWVVPNHSVYMRCTFTATGGTSSDKLLGLQARAGY